jgi:hypothetical protein
VGPGRPIFAALLLLPRPCDAGHIIRRAFGSILGNDDTTSSVAMKELTMLTALVLICSVAVTPDLRDCTRDNASAAMRVPANFGNPVTCFMHGQAYLAGTSIGQELAANERVKVVCARNETLSASVPWLTTR